MKVFFEVYNELGSGFLESVYVEALAIALGEAGLTVKREVPLSVHFRGKPVGDFRADLIVGGAVLVEVKSGSALHPAHNAQTLNYLRATVLEVALLLNFGPRPTIKRFVFDNSQKPCSMQPCQATGSFSHERNNPTPSVFIRGLNNYLAPPQ